MSATYETLVRLILPEGILEYFELTNVTQTETGLNIYLEEKNIAPLGYENRRLESKGFLPETSIQDFPIRGHKVALCIKRRRWEVKETGAICSIRLILEQREKTSFPVKVALMETGRKTGSYFVAIF